MSTAALESASPPDGVAATGGEAAAARRDWSLLAAATIAFGLGFGINLGTFPNFAVQHLGISREALGVLESFREVPGLLTAGIIGLLAAFRETRLAAVALTVLGLGIGLTGQAHGYWPLVACNVLWSLGLHTWMTLQPSLALTLSRAGRHGHSLGLLNRYSAFAMMGGLLTVVLAARGWGYGLTFALGGLAIAAGAFFVARISAHRGAGLHPGLILRRAYWRYYLLMLLDGGRRQVVDTFAILILVREFHASIQSVALLLIVGNGLTMLVAPTVGRWTDRFGERRVLSLYYGLVACLFFSYTRIGDTAAGLGVAPAWVFYCVYSLDKMLFTAAVGIQTYIRHIAPQEDLAPSLAMGITWNHVAAVSVPLAAGVIWQQYGYQRIFLCGIGLALTSLVMCLTLPRKVG